MNDELNELDHGIFYKTCAILKAVIKNALVPIITLLISVSSVLVNSNISKIEQRLTDNNISNPEIQQLISHAYSWENWLMILFFSLLGLIGLVLLVEIFASIFESVNKVRLKNNVNTVKKSQKSLNGIYKKAKQNLKDLKRGVKDAYDDHVALMNVIGKHERILLQLGMYDLRLKFGRYVAQACAITKNFEYTLKAYTDYLGWTSILIGKGKQGKRYVEKAVSILNERIESYNNAKQLDESQLADLFNCYYYLARCKRHIATTYYARPYLTDSEIQRYMDEARNHVDSMREVNDKLGGKYDEKIKTMLNGIEYNQNLFTFETLHYSDNLNQSQKDDYYRELTKLLDVLQANRKESQTIHDNHRLVKDDSLLYRVTDSIVKFVKAQPHPTSEQLALSASLEGELTAYLDEMNKILNKNIYFDEAMEVYTEEVLEILGENLESNNYLRG